MESRTVKEASVEGVQRRSKPKKHFVFCVKVTWSDGTVNLVYRGYSEFLHLQNMLYQAFPGKIAQPGQTCAKNKSITPLPDSFSSRMNIGETIFRRMEQVNYFLKEILELDNKVSQSIHIKSFLTPTPEDLEPRQQPRRKVRFKKTGKKGKGSFTKTMKGRLQKFGKTRVFGNNISSPIVLEHFMVMDDYKKQAKTDINLKKGKLVDVIEKRECGWWLVDADGEVGWAPALFLEPADEMSEVSNVQTFPIGRGEVYVTSKRYVAVEDDELTFDIGVNLQILEKNFDGWWKASYLGREGWVPSMYLKKLGNERTNSKTGRRKSRLFSTNQLRNPTEEEVEEVVEEIKEESVDNTNKEDKKVSLPRKISEQVLSVMGKKESKEESSKTSPQAKVEIDGASGARKESKDESKTIDTMVEIGSVLLQLNKPDKKSSNPRPRTPETLPRSQRDSDAVKKSPRPSLERRAASALVTGTFDLGSTGGNHGSSKDDSELLRLHKPDQTSSYPRPRTPQTLPRSQKDSDVVTKSPRPTLQRRAVSALVTPTFDLGSTDGNQESSKDDSKLENSRSASRSMESVLPIKVSQNLFALESKWRPETKNVLSSSLPRLHEIPEPNEDERTTQPDPGSPKIPNRLSPSSENSCPEDMESSATLENGADSDTGSCDVSHGCMNSTSVAELTEYLDGFCKQPVGTSKHYKKISLDEDSPRIKAPKRSPPVPSNQTQNPAIDSPRSKAPSRSPPVPNSSGTFPRDKIQQSEDELQKIHTIPKTSFDRKIIRQDPFEKETALQLNGEIQFWSSSDESDTELAQLSSNRVLHPTSRTPPPEDQSITEGHIVISSTQSFEFEVNPPKSVKPPGEDGYYTDIYCTSKSHEVDAEMFLAKGDFVKVLERASTGFWLVQNEEGVRGWTCSSHLYPAPQVNGNVDCPASEEEDEEEEDEEEEEENEDEESSPQMPCRVIENYKGDPYNQEIDLHEDQIVHILHKSESGWWCVQNEEGEIGWAPSNYLEMFDDEDIEYAC